MPPPCRIAFPSSCSLRPNSHCTFLLCYVLCCISVSSASWGLDSSAGIRSDDHCERDVGSDFLFTTETRHDGCQLECVILTSSDDYGRDVTYLVGTRSATHNLTGRQCRDSNHHCDHGRCVEKVRGLSIYVSHIILDATTRNQDSSDNTPPDPYIKINVTSSRGSHQVIQTKVHKDSLKPVFDESFVFANVPEDAEIMFSIFDEDDYFDDLMGWNLLTPATITRSGWNGQLHRYRFSDSSLEGMWANITYA